MPQVPLSQQGLSTQGTPQVRGPQGVVPQGDVAGQQAQQAGAALSNLGGNVTAIGAQMNEDHALATSNSALNEWSEKADAIAQDYRSRVGRDAVDFEGQRVESGVASGKVAEQIEGELRNTESGLAGDLAKRLFRQHAERGMVTVRSRLTAHEADQTKAYVHGERVAAVQRFGRHYAQDGEQVAFDNAMRNARGIFDDAGLGPEQRKEAILKTKTGLHADRVAQKLVEEDTTGADAYLRGLERDEVGVKVRQQLRAKIDRVMGAEKVARGALGIFDRHSNPTDAEKEAKPPAERTGLLPLDEFLSLDEEIADARKPGRAAASDPGSGSKRRMMDDVKALHDAGKITSVERLQYESKIDTLIRREVQIKAVEADETLQELQQTGMSVDSPEFIASYPNLHQRILDLGIHRQARAQGKRETNEAAYDDAWRRFTTGALEKLSAEDLRVTYMPHLSTAHWNHIYGLWSKSQPGGGASGGGKIQSGAVIKWEEAARNHLQHRGYIDGPEKNGIKTPDPDKPEQMKLWRQMTFDLDRAVGAETWTQDQMTQWLDKRFIDQAVTIPPEGTWAGWKLAWNLFFPDSPEAATFRGLDQDVEEAELSRDDTKIKAAKARRARARMTMTDGTEVRADQHVVLGPDGDEIPVRAREFMRDMARLDVMDKRLPDQQYNAIVEIMKSYGAFDPSKQLRPAVRTSIDALFQQYGLDIWPSHEAQWQWWKSNRSQEPWRTVAPPVPSRAFGPGGQDMQQFMEGRK